MHISPRFDTSTGKTTRVNRKQPKDGRGKRAKAPPKPKALGEKQLEAQKDRNSTAPVSAPHIEHPTRSLAVPELKEVKLEMIESSPELNEIETKSEGSAITPVSPPQGVRIVTPLVWRRRADSLRSGTREHMKQNKSSARISRKTMQDIQDFFQSERLTVKPEPGMTEGEKALDEVRRSIQAKKRRATPEQVATPVKKRRIKPHTVHEETTPEDVSTVKCLMLQERYFTSLTKHGEGYLPRNYALVVLPDLFHVIVSLQSGSGFAYVGTIRVDACEEVTKHKDIAKFGLNKRDEEFWRERVRTDHKVFVWKVGSTKSLTPLEIKFASGKFRNRHFRCRKAQLLGGVEVPPPKPSLFSTSGFFMRLLPNRLHKRLQQVAHTLDGRDLQVATACSGSDICVTAVAALLDAMNGEFGVF